MTPNVTLTLTRYNEPDSMVVETLSRACSQQGVSGEVLFIEQASNGTIMEDQFGRANLAFRMIRRQLGGLSHARNLSLDEARYPLVLFLDADALADLDWAAGMARVLGDGRYAIAGSRILPGWPGRIPHFARANVIRDQYSLLDLGLDIFDYPRVVGAAFGVDTSKLPPGLRFDTALGRRDGMLFGGEESDFCERARNAGCGIAYAGNASVTHLVQQDRLRLRWVMRRMFYAGHGRALLGGTPSPSRSPVLEDWLYLPFVLPPYALGWLRGKLMG